MTSLWKQIISFRVELFFFFIFFLKLDNQVTKLFIHLRPKYMYHRFRIWDRNTRLAPVVSALSLRKHAYSNI